MATIVPFPLCCGLRILHGLSIPHSPPYGYNKQGFNGEKYLTDQIKVFLRDSYTSVLAVTNSAQLESEPILEKLGFVLILDGFYNPVHGSQLRLWFYDASPKRSRYNKGTQELTRAGLGALTVKQLKVICKAEVIVIDRSWVKADILEAILGHYKEVAENV